jgi:hypothetical protein
MGKLLDARSEEWDAKSLNAAIKIIPILDGMPLNQARYTLRTAETLLLQTHKVDANNPEVKTIERECDHVPSK